MDLTLKYRPKTFDDVVGQKFITNILKRQVETHTFKNTYLFCGAWGDGKTTCARILANEINKGKSAPIEIDGASNNGVDNIRALIEDSQTSAVGADYKVYIIDEAHMITMQGWNAALKLIEEPPTHCVFIFCTTNPEKLPSTILSRVQRFDFKKISVGEIVERLKYILKGENISTYHRDALIKIATLSDGHMRDAVRMLGACLDVDKNISVELVESAFGLVAQDSVNTFIKSLLLKDMSKCVETYEHCKERSFDGIKLYDAILSTVLDAILKGRNDIRPLLNILYENRKILNRDNADNIFKYIIAVSCDER